MVINIAGKEHRCGTSKKTGNPYDFYVVHFLLPSPHVEGKAARSAIINPSIVNYDSIIVGHKYSVDLDFDGNICDFVPSDR